ncbi:MAG: carboxy terminal-processing peptidase [Verrucomicrobiaceae bacterium]
MMPSLLRFALAPLVAASLLSSPAPAADLNLVGSEMIRLLQNGHYARIPYNEELGLRFFNTYLDTLDPNKSFFTQPEIDGFRDQYGKQFHELLTQGDALEPAEEVFELYRSRVKEHVSIVQALLEKEKFTFDSDEKIITDHEDEPWPQNVDTLRQRWKLDLKNTLLSEHVRRERLNHLAEAQGKESPFKSGMSAEKKISLRYERFLKAILESGKEDIANYVFSAVARSHDPHCEYQSPREHEQFRINVSNELVGIGASLTAEDDGATKIRGIVNGGPADKQGDLKLSDRIVAVDSLNDGNFESVMFLPISKVVEKILGKKGTKVGLKISEGDGPDAPGHVVVIERGTVTIKDELVTAKVIELVTGKKLGLIDIPSFYFTFGRGSKSVSNDLEIIIRRLMKDQVDGIVLDLRANGGGSLDEVARVAGFFVPRGPVVQTRTTSGDVQSLKSTLRKPLYEGPLVMLTDKSSASATEILAAALQDYNRAVVVGESSTFGKGTIQQPIDISRYMPVFADRDRAGWVKFTTGKYYRVSGGSVQQRGVIPDIILPGIGDASEYGEAFMDFALPYDDIRKADGFEPLPRKDLFIDPLRKKSADRISAQKDFHYLQEDILRIKKEDADPYTSLNLEKRIAELTEAEARLKERNAERRARFAEVKKSDDQAMKIYRLTLDDADAESLPIADPDHDDQSYMRLLDDEIANLDDTPDWPSGLDPIHREGLHVLQDLVNLTADKRITLSQ